MDSVAKGLKRNGLPYALDVVNPALRPMLGRLLEWKIGVSYNFQISTGKCGKYMEQLLPDAVHQTLLATCAKAESETLWQAISTMSELFHETATETGYQLDLTHSTLEALNNMKYLRGVYFLPRDAKGLYK